MISGLIALALAGSAAAATVCDADVGSAACGSFQKDTDFSITGTGPYAVAHTNTYNGALLAVTNDPWDKTSVAQTTDGCTFTANADGTAVTEVEYGSHKCSSSVTTACKAGADGTAKMTNTVTLQHLVDNLNTAGAYDLYYHRVLTNPIGGNLKWTAANACRVEMPLSFSCTGANCVEVQNIVCASFAGIAADNFGKLSIECKVPPTFKVRQSTSGTGAGLMAISGSSDFTTATINSCGSGKCQIESTSGAQISTTTPMSGSLVVQAEVQALNMAGQPWSKKLDTFHTANYNLTRASAAAQSLTMPIGVNFHTEEGALLAPGSVAAKFPAGADSVPFLSTQRVELGAIVKPDHGYLRIVAKVAAKGHWFLNQKVDGAQTSADSGATWAAHAHGCAAVSKTDSGASHTAQDYPQAFFRCTDVMKQVNAGDVVRFALSWSIAAQASTSGKAQLLQETPEVDPNAQSVEVQVTIQLGGGETNITTGTADGVASNDNTVTYIIIAVCVIAAALILAVVVVAFLCLRSRSQEQLVAMSPKQATVAAVYDISAPKKADVMDV